MILGILQQFVLKEHVVGPRSTTFLAGAAVVTMAGERREPGMEVTISPLWLWSVHSPRPPRFDHHGTWEWTQPELDRCLYSWSSPSVRKVATSLRDRGLASRAPPTDRQPIHDQPADWHCCRTRSGNYGEPAVTLRAPTDRKDFPSRSLRPASAVAQRGVQRTPHVTGAARDPPPS